MSILGVMYKTLYKVTALTTLLLFAGVADAYGSLRCKGRFIEVGDSAAKVLELCGEPGNRVVTQVPVRQGTLVGFSRFAGFANSEQWVYSRGWGKFPVVLFIDDGHIQRIDHLPRRSSGDE
ncbi:MAG: DUF2845 domain-containing protein [Woeseiaceae bacterium]|nr:DUF2845 domain-containing protein [Woeseiaceae bacterium]